MEAGWGDPAIFNHSQFENVCQELVITDIHILHKSDNILYWVIGYRRCDKPDNIQIMKSRERYAALFDAGLNRFT